MNNNVSEKVSESVVIRVPFHDVDMMEVAWHGHYLKYFEIARCALLDRIAYNYMEMKESGFAWPVVDLRVKYVRPARFGQDIRVTATVLEYENRLVLEYLIEDVATGVKLTRGKTTQVAVSIDTGEMQLVSPPVLWEKLGIAA
ncbi:acyl-CoA thioesterase [Endozoicomonas atrinae]|uniref:acyl-CoA thioesterase n=1 Tax=Endozoicomonas atrinae TaxID=1333660 RepID=UPI0008257201|nr:thioesterase family protein [Endozoicomonas atrinae]